MPTPLIEICVEGIDGLLAAEAAGADRVELCASLMEGGLTPSHGTIRLCLTHGRVPFHPIIRPRGGDFLYSDLEFATMLEDVRACRDLGTAGVVFGCLRPDGRIDEERMTALVQAAGPLSTTCHRAFDMTPDPEEAVEALIRSGVKRVLTSGQRDTAEAGVPIMARTRRAAGDRLVVMGCGGLTTGNIAAIREGTGLVELHFAALKDVPSAMLYRNPEIGMGSVDKDREYTRILTDPDAVRATISAARA